MPGATEAVLTGSDGQLFLSVTDPDSSRIIALARMAIHPGWAGIFGLWVHPDHRRQGLATTLVSAIAMVARENNMPAIYLQVSADNTDGVAFWEGARVRRAPRVHLPRPSVRLSRSRRHPVATGRAHPGQGGVACGFVQMMWSSGT